MPPLLQSAAFRPLLCTFGLFSRYFFFRATPAVTRDLGFCGDLGFWSHPKDRLMGPVLTKVTIGEHLF